jgi:Arc/MetJ-type ribon-helix-helix transcriptional regulator
MTWSYRREEAPMTVKTTLSFTDRHHRFLTEQVEKGVFASASAGVAAAVERMIQDEEARQAVLSALAVEIRARVSSPRADYRDEEATFAAALAEVEAAAEG